MFLGLSYLAWLTIVVIIAMFVILFKTTLAPDVVFLGAITILFVTGAVDEKSALGGFSSASVVTVAAMFIVVGGLYQTGVLKWVVNHVLGRPKSYTMAIIRLLFPAALLSSVVTDSVVTALFIKVVKIWAKRLNFAASKLLIPMSYACLVGGTLTLLGTAPNLIVSGLYADDTGNHMNIFTITPPALVCLFVFVIAVIVMKNVLPTRKSPDESFENTTEYTAELTVPADSTETGKTVKEAGLDNVPGGHLVEIIRFDKEVISPVPDDEFIMGGDRLVFSGNIEQINELKKTHRLAISSQPVFTLDEDDTRGRQLRTVTVKFKSSLAGCRMSDTDFEKRNGIVLVAVSRDGERVGDSPRNIVLAPGDTLLVECPSAMKIEDFAEKTKDDLLVVRDEEVIETSSKTIVSVLILLGMILLSSFKVLTVVQSAMLAALAMVVLRCCSPKMAQKSIEWNIIMMFACSVVLGKAIQNNGIAEVVVTGITGICGQNVLLTMVLLSATALTLTEFISNTACSAIFYPIFYQSALNLNLDPKAFCIMLMLCVSMSFATPIGSPGNTMVYGPGGYRFSDFMKIGIPMNIIMLITIVTTIYLMYII